MLVQKIIRMEGVLFSDARLTGVRKASVFSLSKRHVVTRVLCSGEQKQLVSNE